MLFSTGGTRNRTPAPYGGAVEQVGSRQRVLVDAKDASQTFGTSDPVKANSGMTEGPDALIMCGGGGISIVPGNQSLFRSKNVVKNFKKDSNVPEGRLLWGSGPITPSVRFRGTSAKNR